MNDPVYKLTIAGTGEVRDKDCNLLNQQDQQEESEQENKK